MKALVIGGTGPTGPYIVEGLMERGFATTILHRGHHEIDLPAEIEHIHTDPHFSDALGAALRGRRFDVVIATYGRLRLLIEALLGVTERLITVGGSAYGDNGGRPATETAPRYTGNPLTEKILRTEELLADAHRDGRYSITHLRYPHLYGPRQLAPREWSIIRRLLDGRRTIPVLNGGLSLESRAYVENAANAVLVAVDHPAESAGQQYNVADEYTPPDYLRVLAIGRAMGVEVNLANFPDAMGAPAYWWGVNRDLDFAATGRPPSTHHLLIDSTKIRAELGFTDVVDFEVATRRTVEWYLEHPLHRGGPEEAQIGDPFDYEAEDAYLALLHEMTATAARIPFAGVRYDHPYPHPKSALRGVDRQRQGPHVS